MQRSSTIFSLLVAGRFYFDAQNNHTSLKTPSITRNIKAVLAALLVAVLLLLAGGIYLFTSYESIIRKKLQAALPESLSVDFTSIEIDPFAGSAKLKGLTAKYKPQSLSGHYHALTIESVDASGVGITALLRREKIIIEKLILTGGELVLDYVLLNDTTVTDDLASPAQGNTVKGPLEIGSLSIGDLSFVLKGDSTNVCTLQSNVKVNDIGVDLTVPFDIKTAAHRIEELDFTKIVFNPQAGMYGYTISRVNYRDQQLAVDSLTIKSRHPKFKFAHLKGKQIDVFDLRIDRIAVEDFQVMSLLDSTIEASSVAIRGATLHAFRDKRMPFIKNHGEPLPVTAFKELPFAVRVGSLTLKNTDVVYEEFPEVGEASGSVSFRDIDAQFSRLDNRADSVNTFIDVNVEARFMESGLLTARFAFPMNPRNLYYVEGTLDNFELTTLNPTLENLVMVRILSGKMNSMSFNFDYNNDESNGSMVLLYEDLEMNALKEKESKTVVNKIKSFFLNVLFAKKNTRDKVKIVKRNGAIQFTRDEKRSIFNYWWKSLATGIKSSHSVNNILDGKE